MTKYKKEYNTKRKRNISTNINMTKEEHDQLKEICSKLGITKIQFLIRAMEQYKEVTSHEEI